MATVVVVVGVSWSWRITETVRSMIVPVGATSEKRELELETCQKAAKDCWGGTDDTWAGRVTDTVVSDISTLGLLVEVPAQLMAHVAEAP